MSTCGAYDDRDESYPAHQACLLPSGHEGGHVWTEVVHCDSGCLTPDEPKTQEEVRAAYEHWRRHGCLSGCSHGR